MAVEVIISVVRIETRRLLKGLLLNEETVMVPHLLDTLNLLVVVERTGRNDT